MIENLKSLLVVLAIATLVIATGRSIALRWIAREDLKRRVVCWYALTVLGFVSPSFWLYALIAAPLMAWAAQKDANPLGLYAFLFFVIPPLPIDIPTGGFLNLFYIDNSRLLGFAILLPLAVQTMTARRHVPASTVASADWLIAVYGFLQIAQLVPYESVTNTMRRTFLFGLDVVLIYYVFGRAHRTKQQVDDTLASFAFAGAVLALLAAFESLKGWLLYTQIGNMWGSANEFAWLFRGDRLRAQVSTGHALSLGYMLAVALGFWVYLRSNVESRRAILLCGLLYCVGLYFTFSRGPMLTAALMVVVYSVLGQRSPRRALVTLGALGLVVALFLWSPLGSNVAETLPFIGTQDQDTVNYRQQLATVSWELIQRNPWFGDPFVMLNMEALRQGQGIIDLVNAYASVALFNGLVGLTLFVGAFVAGLAAAYKRFRACDVDVATHIPMRRLGAVLIAGMLATMLFMGTAGNAWLQWQFLGMLVAYATMALPVASRSASPTVVIEPVFRSPRHRAVP